MIKKSLKIIMEIIDTSNTMNEKSTSSSEVNIISKKIENFFPEEKPTDKTLNHIHTVKAKKDFIIPSNLKKTFKFIIALSIIGIILFFCGILKAILQKNILGGIFFWILSLLVLIPGGFYSLQFYKAKKAKTEFERQEILNKIPKLQKSLF